MRLLFTVILSIVCSITLAQKIHIPVKVYKVITYSPTGKQNVKLDTVPQNVVITDLKYFAKHYNYPKQWLPDSLKNPIYKNQKVIIDFGGPANSQYHRTKYTVYDSLSRVTTFGMSTCMVCEFSPTEYKVTYNAFGNIEKIDKVYFPMGNIYAILYYPSGNIKQLDQFTSGVLVKRIESF